MHNPAEPSLETCLVERHGWKVASAPPKQFEPELVEAANAGEPVAVFVAAPPEPVVFTYYVFTNRRAAQRRPERTGRARRSRATRRVARASSSSDDPGLADQVPPRACGLRGVAR